MDNPKWLALASLMLAEASEQFSRHGCNDWTFPDDWTPEERGAFAQAIERWNGGGEFRSPWPPPPDWLVMRFLGDWLAGKTTDETPRMSIPIECAAFLGSAEAAGMTLAGVRETVRRRWGAGVDRALEPHYRQEADHA